MVKITEINCVRTHALICISWLTANQSDCHWHHFADWRWCFNSYIKSIMPQNIWICHNSKHYFFKFRFVPTSTMNVLSKILGTYAFDFMKPWLRTARQAITSLPCFSLHVHGVKAKTLPCREEDWYNLQVWQGINTASLHPYTALCVVDTGSGVITLKGRLIQNFRH